MTRRESREAAVRLMYEYGYHTETDAQEIISRASQLRGEGFSAFTRELFTGACLHLGEIDGIISASADNWRIGRIARVPLAVLRIAAEELLASEHGEKKTDARIIINEALEICRTYADENAVAFVNGVLAKALVMLKGEKQ